MTDRGDDSMITWLRADSAFPPIEAALDEPNGLLAAGGDLSPGRILAAYRRGIFPWFGAGQPILWWSPDPRMVLYVDEFHVSRSLRKRVQRGRIRDARRHCVRRRDRGVRADAAATASRTWITPAMMRRVPRAASREGFGHSVEAWRDGELVGGLYGLALGRMFFGESMFAHETDASKVALVGPGRRCCGAGRAADRLPAGDGAPGVVRRAADSAARVCGASRELIHSTDTARRLDAQGRSTKAR